MTVGGPEMWDGGVDGGNYCPACGAPRHPAHNAVLTHGSVTVAFDPVNVKWRGQRVPLSKTEAHLFAQVALRGRATYGEIDAALEGLGVGRARRRKSLHCIRRKFKALGAADPFAPLHQIGLRIADAYSR